MDWRTRGRWRGCRSWPIACTSRAPDRNAALTSSETATDGVRSAATAGTSGSASGRGVSSLTTSSSRSRGRRRRTNSPTRERRRQHAQDRRAEHIHDLGLELDAWSIMDDRRLEAEAAALLAEQSPQRVEAPACVECGATESVGLCRGEWRCGECLSRASARGRQNRARTRQNGR